MAAKVQPKAKVQAKKSDGVSPRSVRDVKDRFEAKADYFVYEQKGVFWEYVNAELVVAAVGGFFKAKADAAVGLADTDQSGSWSLRVEEHFRSGELVSLRLLEYANFGGAHPNQGTYTKNFAGPDLGKVDLSEIFERNDAVLKFLKEQSEAGVKRQLAGEGGGDAYDLTPFMEGEGVDPWSLFAQWNFSREQLCICLGSYSGLPHAMGEFQVPIPWDFFRDKVSPVYRQTPIGRLITGAPK